MTMKTRTSTTTHSTLTDDEGREFELPIAGEMGGFDPLVAELADGRILISYPLLDDDAQHMDPRQDENGWQEFIVLDNQRDADDLSSKLNDCASCGYHCTDHVDDDGNPRTDLEAWIGCDGFEPSDARKAIDAGRAFLFEKYEHGLVRYALRGESSAVDRQWDVSPVAGFMWADDNWGPDVDIKEAARGFLDTFTSWCNGDVWGIVHAWFKYEGGDPERADTGWVIDSDEDVESCWGFIGSEHAEAELTAAHNHYAGKDTNADT